MALILKHHCHKHLFSRSVVSCSVCHLPLCEKCQRFDERYQTHFCMQHFRLLQEYVFSALYCFKSSSDLAEYGVWFFEEQKKLYKLNLVTFLSPHYLTEEDSIFTVMTLFCLPHQRKAVSFALFNKKKGDE